jgi:hypothetical protein
MNKLINNLHNLSDFEFDKLKSSIITKLTEQPKNFNEENNTFLLELICKTYMFGSENLKASVCKTMGKKEFIDRVKKFWRGDNYNEQTEKLVEQAVDKQVAESKEKNKKENEIEGTSVPETSTTEPANYESPFTDYLLPESSLDPSTYTNSQRVYIRIHKKLDENLRWKKPRNLDNPKFPYTTDLFDSENGDGENNVNNELIKKYLNGSEYYFIENLEQFKAAAPLLGRFSFW